MSLNLVLCYFYIHRYQLQDSIYLYIIMYVFFSCIQKEYLAYYYIFQCVSYESITVELGKVSSAK